MEKIVWFVLVGNEVLHAVKKDRNVLQAIKRRKGLVTSCVETAF